MVCTEGGGSSSFSEGEREGTSREHQSDVEKHRFGPRFSQAEVLCHLQHLRLQPLQLRLHLQ
jgi:hypothetical protein